MVDLLSWMTISKTFNVINLTLFQLFRNNSRTSSLEVEVKDDDTY